MLYLFYGTKDSLIKEEIKKIKEKFNELNISWFDLNTTDITNIIDDCITISLFANKKLVICENADIFTGTSSQNTNLIEKYLNNPNPNTTLIFITNNEKIDERKKITKIIKSKGIIKAFNTDINPITLVKKELINYKIDKDAIDLLIDRVGANPLILKNEINKLKLYKDNNNITKEDIIATTTKKIDADIFKLLDYIVQNNKNKALEIYYEMLKLNEEPIKIIIMLANQFRIMYQTKELTKKGLTEKDIASTLKIHPYRVKLALQNSKKYTSEILLQYISDLADIDYDIKTGRVDKALALELFILKK